MAKKFAPVLGAPTANKTVGNPMEKIKELDSNSTYTFNFIEKDKIHPNKKNDKYNQDGIEELKDSILVNGLRHNLSVIFEGETNSYRIISGERRYNAICSMTDEQYKKAFPSGIPCKIEKASLNEIDEEIMLISANHDVREQSMEVKRWEISRLMELYGAKKSTGEISSVIAEIAKNLEITKRQAQKYVNAEKLIPELSHMLNEKGITLDQASEYASLSEPVQRSILDLIKKNGGVDNTELKVIKAQAAEQKKRLLELSKELEDTSKTLASKDSLIENLEKQVTKLSTEQPATETKEELQEKLELLRKSLKKVTYEKTSLQAQMDELKNKKSAILTDTGNNEEIKAAKRKMTISTLTTTIATATKELTKYRKDVSLSEDVKAQLAEIYARIEDLIS